MIVNMNQKNGSYSIMCEQIAIESRNAVLAELACHYLNGVRKDDILLKTVENCYIEDSPSFLKTISDYYIRNLKHWLQSNAFRIDCFNYVLDIRRLTTSSSYILRLSDGGRFIVTNDSKQLISCNINTLSALEFIHAMGLSLPETESTYYEVDLTIQYANWCNFSNR
ncbi:hypothetical protein C0W66_21195 [Photobacterium kishitanii]|nr:hypothetical protein AYY23_19950 [Photobacterium kishitanii]PSW46904.1 hypothetical protein C0W66_21195 [Photobacterium kishitanii]